MTDTEILGWLRSADKNGMLMEGTPSLGVMSKLAAKGLLDVITPDGWLGGTYRINDKGREFLEAHAVDILLDDLRDIQRESQRIANALPRILEQLEALKAAGEKVER